MGTAKVNSLSAATRLQSKSDALVQAKTTHVNSFRTKEEALRHVHELEIHQVELEKQISKLSKAKEEVERALKTYTDLYDFAPVGYFTITRNGRIRKVNLTGAGLVGGERYKLSGRSFVKLVKDEYQIEIKSFLDMAFSSRGKETCEVVLMDKENVPHFVQIEAMINDSGQECRLALIDLTDRLEPPVCL